MEILMKSLKTTQFYQPNPCYHPETLFRLRQFPNWRKIYKGKIINCLHKLNISRSYTISQLRIGKIRRGLSISLQSPAHFYNSLMVTASVKNDTSTTN
jgi:hypothetical protein